MFFLIWAFCCSLIPLEFRAIYKYYLGLIVLPWSSTNCREKSLTTQMKEGLEDLVYCSILATRFNTRLRVWSAFSSMFPTLL